MEYVIEREIRLNRDTVFHSCGLTALKLVDVDECVFDMLLHVDIWGTVDAPLSGVLQQPPLIHESLVSAMQPDKEENKRCIYFSRANPPEVRHFNSAKPAPKY